MFSKAKLVGKLQALQREAEAEYIKALPEKEYKVLCKEMAEYAMAREKTKYAVMREVALKLDQLELTYTHAEVLAAVAAVASTMLADPLLGTRTMEEKIKFIDSGNTFMNAIAYIKEKMDGNIIKN